MMIQKILSFRYALKHNFRAMDKKARRRAEFADPAVMESEIAQYKTTLGACLCGGTIHLSVMYRTSCPCSHQYALGTRTPSSPNIELVLTEVSEELIITMERIERTLSRCAHHAQRE
jgi:GTP cyclohydrolase FolE2